MGLRRLALRSRRGLVAILAITAIGYASSAMSRTGAERAAGDRIAWQLGTRDVYVLADDPTSLIDYPGSSAVLSRAEFSVRECRQTGDHFNCFPWAGMSPGKVLGPFVIEVRWGAN